MFVSRITYTFSGNAIGTFDTSGVSTTVGSGSKERSHEHTSVGTFKEVDASEVTFSDGSLFFVSILTSTGETAIVVNASKSTVLVFTS